MFRSYVTDYMNAERKKDDDIIELEAQIIRGLEFTIIYDQSNHK